LEYANAGLFDEAIDLLSVTGLIDDTVSGFPLTSYYLGYFWSKKGDPSRGLEYYRRASEMSSDYCFPFRLEEIAILKAVLKVNPADAKAPYYLGNLLYDLQPEEAIKMWERSKEIDDSFALVHRNLGYAYTEVFDDLQGSIVSFEKAISLNNKKQSWFYDLDIRYAALRTDPLERLKLLQDNSAVLINDNVVNGLSRKLVLLVQLGHYDRALEIFNNRTFPQFEGVDRVYDSYLNSLLLRGYNHLEAGRYQDALQDGLTALQYPSNITIDQAYRGGRTIEVLYFSGAVYDQMGDKDKATEFWTEGINIPESRSGTHDNTFYRALCLQNLGKTEESVSFFESLITIGRDRIEAEQIDFFEKFGERETKDDRRADGHYLMGLGYLGMGMESEAKREFSEAERLNINHLWAKEYLIRLRQKEQ
jgi:tetratricopeptide (TPR) repeat protein